MVSLKTILIFVILINSLPSLSQTDTTALSYYPLHKNNYWQYLKFEQELWTPDTWTSYYSIEVLGDTILPNGKSYKILERVSLDSLQPSYSYFERIDTLTCNVYYYNFRADSQEILINSLKSQVDDTSFAYRGMWGFYGEGSYCDSIFNESILGIRTISKRIQLLDPLNVQNYKLSKDFGITYQYASYDFGYTTVDLMYAIIDGRQYGEPVQIKSHKSSEIPQSVLLYPNYPNPFNSTTAIRFYLTRSEMVELSIYSIDGHLIDRLVSSKLQPGFYNYKWDATNNSSGVYIFQLTADGHIYNQKSILIK